MFTTPCFIRKNTPKLREYLKNIGIECLSCIGKRNVIFCRHGNYYCAYSSLNNQNIFYLDRFSEFKCSLNEGSLDCVFNEDLFKAVSALKNDSDINQWFVMGVGVYKDIHKGDWFLATDIEGGKHVGTQIDPLYCHKATVKELIGHFK